MCLSTLFFLDLQAISRESSITLPLWLFWVLVGLIGTLIILLFLRDRALRRSLKNAFLGARRRMKKARLEGRIKKETKEKEKALFELGQKAWSVGVKSEPAADILDDIKALEQKKKGHLQEIETIDKEIEKIQNAHDEYRKGQEEKIKHQEEAKTPHVEHLSQTKESLKKSEADLSHIEKEVRASEKEKNDAEKNISKVEEDTKLSDEMKQTKIEELKAKIFEMTKKKEELEAKQPAIQEQKVKLEQQKADDQEKIKEFDQTIAEFRDEEKEQQKVFDKEMKQWQKKKDTLLEKNEDIEKQKQPLFARLGKALNEQRIDDPALAEVYARIDTTDKAVQEYEEKRKELEK